MTVPSWTIRLSDRSSGSDLASLLAPETNEVGFVVAHDDPGVRAADERTAIHQLIDCFNIATLLTLC